MAHGIGDVELYGRRAVFERRGELPEPGGVCNQPLSRKPLLCMNRSRIGQNRALETTGEGFAGERYRQGALERRALPVRATRSPELQVRRRARAEIRGLLSRRQSR